MHSFRGLRRSFVWGGDYFPIFFNYLALLYATQTTTGMRCLPFYLLGVGSFLYSQLPIIRLLPFPQFAYSTPSNMYRQTSLWAPPREGGPIERFSYAERLF